MSRDLPDVHRVPLSTYRVQLTPEFGFAAATEIVPYLSRLGISDLYCSPILTARPGSTHGYDVVDPLRLNPELGGEEGFEELVQALQQHEMGLLLDIVPNHMAASTDNPWWSDLLAHGRSSRFAPFFDIEWMPAGPIAIENRVLLPILGTPYGEALENGEIRIEQDDQGFRLRYFDLTLPIAVASYGPILRLRAAKIERALGAESAAWKSFSSLLDRAEAIAENASVDQELSERPNQTRASLQRELPRLLQNPDVARELGIAVTTINGIRGKPRSFDLLDQIVSGQAYRLAYWQLAREQINYRRFFDINDLVSMRVEDESVFNATHELILRLVKSGKVNGLRVDHVDGLWDPEGYLRRLQLTLAHSNRMSANDTGQYIVVEKILAAGETLPHDWAVAGTTGYDFLAVINGLMVDPGGLAELDRLYRQLTDESSDFAEIVYTAKRGALEQTFAANVASLTALLASIAAGDRHGRDLTIESLREALIEVSAALSIYRTYINAFDVHRRDRDWIEDAVERSMIRRPDLRYALSFLQRILLLHLPHSTDELERKDWLRFVMRWQQLTGPAMAKGSEDTALYRYNRLLSLNEVGGHPDVGGVTVSEFHAHNQRIRQNWPDTLIALATHDTKRGEDVRARIAVLSEIPDTWERALTRWRELNAEKTPVRNGVRIPDSNVELQIYQTMLGAWPHDQNEVARFRERLKAYLIKAAREAKTATSWVDPDEVYEEALLSFVDSIFDAEASAEFLLDFARLWREVSRAGAVNSLSQALLKLTSPGVPDTYQGSELWDLSLVDPDNRRPVDFDRRRRVLDSIESKQSTAVVELLDHWQDGRIKLLVLSRALQLRGTHPELFASGAYLPCKVSGPRAAHAIAFVRKSAQAMVLTVVPRLVHDLVEPSGPLNLRDCWGDTVVQLPEPSTVRWRDVIAGRDVEILTSNGRSSVRIAEVLGHFPVGLLIAGQ